MNASVGCGVGLASTPHTARLTSPAAQFARKTVHRSCRPACGTDNPGRGNAIITVGELPAAGSPALAFTPDRGDLG